VGTGTAAQGRITEVVLFSHKFGNQAKEAVGWTASTGWNSLYASIFINRELNQIRLNVWTEPQDLKNGIDVKKAPSYWVGHTIKTAHPPIDGFAMVALGSAGVIVPTSGAAKSLPQSTTAIMGSNYQPKHSILSPRGIVDRAMALNSWIDNKYGWIPGVSHLTNENRLLHDMLRREELNSACRR
jgi:hypothetical protein